MPQTNAHHFQYTCHFSIATPTSNNEHSTAYENIHRALTGRLEALEAQRAVAPVVYRTLSAIAETTLSNIADWAAGTPNNLVTA